jgi:hypothetical protein
MSLSDLELQYGQASSTVFHSYNEYFPVLPLLFAFSSYVHILLKLTPWRQIPKIHHRIHNSPRTIPILSQIDPLPTSQPISLRSILIPSSHLRLGLSNGLLPSGFPTKTLYLFIPSPMRATCPAHLILRHLICLTISDDEYKI